MTEKKFQRLERASTTEERRRHADIRDKISAEFPPAQTSLPESPPGLPTQFRQARMAQGLTWHALAKLAGLPDSGVIRDIEQGRDAPCSTLQLLAKALGMRLDLVEETV